MDFMGPSGKFAVSFSVIMCVDRQLPWLAEAIESILGQDDRQFEFLIAANNCTDELWNFLETLSHRDDRIKLYRTQVGQLTFNLNYLANVASGDYLVRMDDDDVSEPDRLTTLRLELENHSVDILGSAATLINGDGDVLGLMVYPISSQEIIARITNEAVFCHPTVAIRRSFLLAVRGYSGGFATEDKDLWLRAINSGATMRNLSRALLRYRVHDGQTSGSRESYAENASLWMREFLLKGNFWAAKGLLIAILKFFFRRFLPGTRRFNN